MKILGCWYSNSGIHPNILNFSLASIKRARDSYGKANIVTCNWEHIPNNPFEEHIALYKYGNHLGIILQMLRIIYEEEKKGNNYDIVSFLEHDVLYPDDYFYRIKDGFYSNPQAVINLDYIGMNQTGWLDVVQRDEPMHQFSLKYSAAMKHFDLIMREAVTKGSVYLEQGKFSTIRIPFKGDKPSCHINHSRHFTNHYDCYAKNSNGKIIHQYWGDFRRYYPQGEKSRQ